MDGPHSKHKEVRSFKQIFDPKNSVKNILLYRTTFRQLTENRSGKSKSRNGIVSGSELMRG
jgi:hypothetical protein